jgi:hypothetical protein
VRLVSCVYRQVLRKQLVLFDTIYCTVIVNDAFRMHCQLGNCILQMSDSYGLSGSAAAVEVHVLQMKSLQVNICILSLFACTCN